MPLTTELTMLAYSVALMFVLILVQSTTAVQSQGGKVMAGNRDELAPAKPLEGRTRRILYNHIEAMAMFAPLVLIAAVQHISNGATALGAQLFFYARLAYAIVYLIGIPYLRTIVWLAGVAGIAIVFLALFGVAA
jgi:uncharacterized MAPEG superfamily protein